MDARLQQMLASLQGRNAAPAVDQPLPDTSEKIQISSLSLLKMLKHGDHSVHNFLDLPFSFFSS
jgi:26S proteasome regulatory subunit N11